jgi:hypothetical protein
MLKYKIRRLPVVDDQGFALGVVARSDIFKPLFLDVYNQFMEREKLALKGIDIATAAASTTAAAAAAGAASPAASSAASATGWKIKYLYDGDCLMCQVRSPPPSPPLSGAILSSYPPFPPASSFTL